MKNSIILIVTFVSLAYSLPTHSIVNNNVDITLYYETLCPYCKQFITGQLFKTYNILGNIMNVTLVPYGNAKELFRPETQLYQFYCQHGNEECYGNLFHTCLISLYPRVSDHLPVINCMEASSDDIETAGDACAKQFNLSADKISDCMYSEAGNALQHQMAVLTGRFLCYLN
jgi:interferon gamma-inducible protein 30